MRNFCKTMTLQLILAAQICVGIESSAATSISGVVTDAVTGLPLAGVLVKVGAASITTDSNGAYRVDGLPAGSLGADFDADITSGVAPLSVGFQNLSGENRHVVTGTLSEYLSYGSKVEILPDTEKVLSFAMSPVIINDETRIVLNWGAIPDDLDSHLVTPLIEGSTFHVYYSDRGDLLNAPYAALDVDDVTSYGPETITLTKRFPGTYHYFVHNYSETDSFPVSEACVKFYSKDGLLRSVTPPSSGTGLYWHVATLDGTSGRITLLNVITDSKDLPSGSTLPQSAAAHFASPESAPMTYLWNFGDGQTSTEENPVHTYTAGGDYTVSLTATKDSASDVETKTNYIFIRSTYHTVDFVSATGGTISGTTPQTIVDGGTCSAVTAFSNTGYRFVNWTGTGGFATATGNPLTVSNVTADMTITAIFAPKSNQTITFQALPATTNSDPDFDRRTAAKYRARCGCRKTSGSSRANTAPSRLSSS